MMVRLFGFGMCYFLLAMLPTQCLSDSYALIFILTLAEIILLPIFRTDTMETLGSGQNKYYFFGYNQFFPSIHNFWIAYSMAALTALLYSAVDYWRHFLKFRTSLRRCVGILN